MQWLGDSVKHRVEGMCVQGRRTRVHQLRVLHACVKGSWPAQMWEGTHVYLWSGWLAVWSCWPVKQLPMK